MTASATSRTVAGAGTVTRSVVRPSSSASLANTSTSTVMGVADADVDDLEIAHMMREESTLKRVGAAPPGAAP